jgi:hypothetical protein
VLNTPGVKAVDSRVPVVHVVEGFNIDPSDIVAKVIIFATRLTEKAVVKRLIYVNAKAT